MQSFVQGPQAWRIIQEHFQNIRIYSSWFFKPKHMYFDTFFLHVSQNPGERQAQTESEEEKR